MLYGSHYMDVVNGIKTGDGINGMKIGDGAIGVNGNSGGNGIQTGGNSTKLANDRKAVDSFIGVAHTDNQAADLAKALV
jgi:hypothetical protein